MAGSRWQAFWNRGGWGKAVLAAAVYIAVYQLIGLVQCFLVIGLARIVFTLAYIRTKKHPRLLRRPSPHRLGHLHRQPRLHLIPASILDTGKSRTAQPRWSAPIVILRQIVPRRRRAADRRNRT